MSKLKPWESKVICNIKGHDWYHLEKPGVDITYCMRCFKFPAPTPSKITEKHE